MHAVRASATLSGGSVSAVVEQNTASTQEMEGNADPVSQAIEGVASISEENGAAAEVVSASVEEMSAQAEEVTASAQSLNMLAEGLQEAVSRFQLGDGDGWEAATADVQDPTDASDVFEYDAGAVDEDLPAQDADVAENGEPGIEYSVGAEDDAAQWEILEGDAPRHTRALDPEMLLAKEAWEPADDPDPSDAPASDGEVDAND